MKAFELLRKAYDRCEEVFIVTLLAASTLIIFYQVVMRYVFSAAPAWTEELAKIMFVWMSWLGVSLGQKKQSHICIEVLTGKLHGKSRAAVLMVGDILTIIICIVLIRYGYVVTELIMKIKQTSAALKFPMWIVYASCPFACFMMSLRLLGHILEQIQILRGHEKEAEGT